MQGTVLNIQRFCTSDGPGIRTTVFLKGCPLTCLWCHNPESQRRKPELLYSPTECVSCGRCTSACPRGCHQQKSGQHTFDRSVCVACGACRFPLCKAIELSGKTMSAKEVFDEVVKDAAFYRNSGGGMTLSGGEPLLQADFAIELLGLAREAGIHKAIETCGYAPRKVVASIAELVDLFLFDYKESDPERHRRFTGVDNAQILENLTLLDDMKKSIVLRCPIIPDYNDRDDHFASIAALANRLSHVTEIQIEPYHDFGKTKYAKLERAYALSDVLPADREVARRYVSAIQARTDTPVRIP